MTSTGIEEGDLLGNLENFVSCFTELQCAAVPEFADAGSMFLVICLALLFGGAWLTSYGAEWLNDTAMPGRRLEPVLVLIGTYLLWLALFFAYAVPALQHLDPVSWTIATPLYTGALVLGLALMVAFGWLVVFAVKRPGFLTPSTRWGRLLLTLFLVGVLIAWRAAYTQVPEIAAGPFNRGPLWLQGLMDIWLVQWPVWGLWEVLTTFATVPGIAGVAVLGLSTTVLPHPDAGSRLTRGIAGTASATAAIILSVVVTVVVGVVVLAVAAFAFFALVLYALWLAIGALVAAGIMSAVFKR